MGFLTKEGLQNLTNKLVQGDAIKVASHRGKNVKEVIDNIQRECESVALPNTMTLENRVSEFKVGQGRDIDVSGDVEEGKIEVELQGKTYQNLVEYIADYEGYEKNGSYYNKNASRKLSFGLKPNTVYTRILDVKECFEPFWMYDSINNSDGTYRQYSYRIKQGLVINKFTSSDLGTINSYTFNPDQNVTNKENFNIVIGRMFLLEGDHTQTPLEELPRYFEGIKSSFEDGVVDVEVQGKNLFDGNYTLEMSDKRLTTSYIKVEPNTGYICLFNDVVFNRNSLMQYNSSKEQISYSAFPSFFVTSQDTHFVRLQWYNKKGSDLVITEDMIAKANIQLEKGKTSTSYEPYYKKKISFNIEESLRSLPNGISDEITDDGQLIRRVGKKIFNGNESYNYSGDHVSHGDYVVFHTSLPSGSSNVGYCDRFPSTIKATDHTGTHLYEAMFINTNYSVIYFKINKTKLESIDNAGVKKWFSENPTTVYYELKTPIITPIEPMEFDVKPLATMTINSEIAPISNHKVVLNRAGQIEQGIQLIADLRNRVNTLENIYDSNLIATQYKLDNLKLNYELEREED